MTTTTIINHKLTDDGFAIVVTTFAPRFRAMCQHYRTLQGGHLQLISEKAFTSEDYAEEAFDSIPSKTVTE